MHVIGTAGHVDHGKSTLIKALTGIDPDRLREEKERQMTIDLGFAWLELPSGEEIGIVDVPGHRDFIENMLAGAGGMDAVLFIIAADEGIMPQTREHLAILKLLEIKFGIIVLSKIDIVEDREWVDLVKSDIRQFTRNSFLSGSPIIEVSSINGTGIDELLGGIVKMLEICESKKDSGKGRLPVDRVFSIKGFGTVVTGTMLDGIFTVGQQVEILPKKLEVRIRGIQSHKKKIQKAHPGSRTAINLAGLEKADIDRGDVVAQVGMYKPAKLIDVNFKMIEQATGSLSHNDEIKIFTGTTQSLARVRLIEKQKIKPGQEGWLQLELKNHIVVDRGDHFIIRRPSPPETIGGGAILDPFPHRRHRRFSRNVIEHFSLMQTGTLKERILSATHDNPMMTIQMIQESCGVNYDELVKDINQMLDIKLIALDNENEKINKDTHIISIKDWQEKSNLIVNEVIEFHTQNPLRQGIEKSAVRNITNLDFGEFSLLINSMISKGLLVKQSGLLKIPDHQVEITSDIEQRMDAVIQTMQSSPFSPPALSELRRTFSEDLIELMITKGILIVASSEIAFLKEKFDFMSQRLVQYISENNEISISQFRDLFKTSRKYSLAFLEYMDKIGVTEFNGEKRTIRDIDKLKL